MENIMKSGFKIGPKITCTARVAKDAERRRISASRQLLRSELKPAAHQT